MSRQRKERPHSARTEQIGVLSLLQLLNKAGLPSLEVDRESDYGIDILAHAIEEDFDPSPSAGEPDGPESEPESEYVQRWLRRLYGQGAGGDPRLFPTARMIGFQVKTSTAFTCTDAEWGDDIDIGNLHFWNSAPFPVYVVFSNAEGDLRYTRGDTFDPREDQATQRVKATQPFDAEQLQRILADVRGAATLELARDQAWGMFSVDPDAQCLAVLALWPCLLHQPLLGRALISRLPRLEPVARTEASRMVSAYLELTDTLRKEFPDDPEAEQLWAAFGFDLLDTYSPSDWRQVLAGWKPARIERIDSGRFVSDGNGGYARIPTDAFPEGVFPGIVGRWLTDGLRRSRERLASQLFIDPEIKMLSALSDPTSLIVSLAVHDLAQPQPAQQGIWWAELLGRVALQHARAVPPSQRARQPYGVAAAAVSRLCTEVPVLGADALVADLLLELEQMTTD